MDSEIVTEDTEGVLKFSEVLEVEEDGEKRTADVLTDGSFQSLLISPHTVNNLAKAGFKKPSPVQVKAIPPGLAGFDMLVQAKSGTGKTLVFTILAVENLNLQSKGVQRLIVAPTREIARQIHDAVKKIAHFYTRIAVFTGGTPVAENREQLKKGVHIVVGTTGRLRQLHEEGSLSLASLSLFVLDEADKMMSSEFEADVNYLFSSLPSTKQVCVFSATYPCLMESLLSRYMTSPVHVRLNWEDVQLIGIKQSQQVCESLSKEGVNVASISSAMLQIDRDDAIQKLKLGKIKVLVSTDLIARGIDAEKVNLVINIGPSFDVDTYLHRIGRAARYGGEGAAVTVLCDNNDLRRYSELVREGSLRVKCLRASAIPSSLTDDRDFYEKSPPFVVKETVAKSESTHRREAIDVEKEESEEEGEETREFGQLLQQAKDITKNLRNKENLNVKSASEENKNGAVVEIQKPAKFKFVPSRLKKAKKYYMRGEMISIRDSISVEQWQEYASKKFPLEEEPFLGGYQKLIEEKKTTSKGNRIKSLKEEPKRAGSVVETLVAQQVSTPKRAGSVVETLVAQQVSTPKRAGSVVETLVAQQVSTPKRAGSVVETLVAQQVSTPKRAGSVVETLVAQQVSTPKRAGSVVETLVAQQVSTPKRAGSVVETLVAQQVSTPKRAGSVVETLVAQQVSTPKRAGSVVETLVAQQVSTPKRAGSVVETLVAQQVSTTTSSEAKDRSGGTITKEEVAGSKCIIAYRREEMIKVSKSISPKVMAERKSAAVQVISSGTEVLPYHILETSVKEYNARLKREFEEWKERGGEQLPRRGPIVHERRPKEEYRALVREASEWRRSFDRNFEYLLDLDLDKIREMLVQTEKVPDDERAHQEENSVECRKTERLEGISQRQKREEEGESEVSDSKEQQSEEEGEEGPEEETPLKEGEEGPLEEGEEGPEEETLLKERPDEESPLHVPDENAIQTWRENYQRNENFFEVYNAYFHNVLRLTR